MRKTMAVVIRTVDYKDNDRMLTLLTRDYGLMSASARGSKKQTGKLFCTSSLFCCGEYTFYEKNGYFGVRSGDTVHSFCNIQDDYDRYAAACFVADAAGKVAQEDFEAPKLFALVVNALYALDGGARPGAVLCYFMQRLLYIEGLYPVTDHCAVCGKTGGLTHFSAEHGGTVCAECADAGAVRTGSAVMEALAQMRDVMPVDMAGIRLDEAAEKKLRALLGALLEHALQKPLKSAKYVGAGGRPMSPGTCG